MAFLDIIDYYAINSMNFLNKLSLSSNLKTIYSLTGHEDLYRLSNLYKADIDVFIKQFNKIILEEFKKGI